MLYYGYKTFYIKNEASIPDNYTYHFALIAEETENDYWRLIEQGAREAAEENNIFLEYVAPKRADNEQLLRLFDRLIAAKVDGIITQGIEGQRFVDLVHKSIERGIPVITIDTDVKSSERNAYVGTDNYYAGQLTGRTIIENTTGEQYVGIVTGRLDAINQQQRIEGLKEEIAPHPRIQIVATLESNITRIGATKATYELLKEHPEINVLVGTSSLDGIGMVTGLEEIAPNKEVYITAFDVLPRTLDLIRSNKIDATIAQYPVEMGKKSVKVMIELQEQVLLDNEFFTETRILEKNDVQQSSGETR
ncbi:sugar ABC transporter substrate-binding protein [Oceanobacillus arenosus]|uniref:Sugar ABC transporter substrate-binding protein n=2 Tax=Oceanobacillus arenosus TaxID=1229153 RepID=A0A3D8Q270_9BACI|nr:sugar ABC transporter substrate-binding protein [Oceanobacillus arenosus]